MQPKESFNKSNEPSNIFLSINPNEIGFVEINGDRYFVMLVDEAAWNNVFKLGGDPLASIIDPLVVGISDEDGFVQTETISSACLRGLIWSNTSGYDDLMVDTGSGNTYRFIKNNRVKLSPDISLFLQVDITRLGHIIIDEKPFFVTYTSPEVWACGLGPVGGIFQEDQFTVLLGYVEDEIVEEKVLSLGDIRELTWDVEKAAYVNPRTNQSYQFLLNSSF